MNTSDYHFSVLRLMPNAIRGERVNIGIVLFHPTKQVTVHLDVNQNRIKALDPNLSAIRWEEWADQAKSILSSLPMEARVNWLRTAFAPITTDTQVGWFQASNGDEIQTNVASLLCRLVKRPQRLQRAERTSGTQSTKLQSQLKQWFKAQNILGRTMADLAKSQVIEEYPVSIDTDSYADFAYKNGALHIIETMDLRGTDHLTARLRNQAAFKSIVLDQARDVTKGGGQRIAVIAASDYSAVKAAIKMIERNADDMISIENANDVDRLVAKITTALHLSVQLTNPVIT